MSGLDSLPAVDRLEVGPVRVEPMRLMAPYTVYRGRSRETIDLIYRFEEAVFEPDDPGSVNLASMIGAQVALNYGLLCREIVFRGPYDGHDQRLFGLEQRRGLTCHRGQQ